MIDYAVMPLNDYVNFCEKIRGKTSTVDDIKSGEMPEKIDEVYEAGRQAEYDEFWDSYQQKGNVYSAQYLFAQSGWNDKTFKPKWSLRYMTNCGNMFNSSAITDLKGILEKQGVTFDFKNSKNLQQFIAYSKITRLPVISSVSAPSFSNFAYNAKDLISIDEIILKDDGSQVFTNAFYTCESLEEIRFSGEIGKPIDLHWSTKLSKESIKSIMNALSFDSSEGEATLSLDAVNKAFETSEGANDGESSEEWFNVWMDAARGPTLI